MLIDEEKKSSLNVERMSSLVDEEKMSHAADDEITDADIEKLIEDELNALNENDLDDETLQDDVYTSEEVYLTFSDFTTEFSKISGFLKITFVDIRGIAQIGEHHPLPMGRSNF